MIIGVISKDDKYDVESKANFIEFLKKGKLRLAQHLRSQLDKTIQNNQDLPEEEFVIERDKDKVGRPNQHHGSRRQFIHYEQGNNKFQQLD